MKIYLTLSDPITHSYLLANLIEFLTDMCCLNRIFLRTYPSLPTNCTGDQVV